MTAVLVHEGDDPPRWRVTVSGEVTADEFAALAADYRASVKRWSRVLIDATAVADAPAMLSLLVRERRSAECPGEVRQAAIVDESAAAVARSWVRLTAPGSGGAQAFVSESAAEAWLLEAVHSTSGGS